MSDVAYDHALVAELAKRTSVSWLAYSGFVRPVWHAWYDQTLCVVAGGEEQPADGLAEAGVVTLMMRSKDTGGRLLTVRTRPKRVSPDDEHWSGVTQALLARRLNLVDPADAVRRWATGSTVCRLYPAG